MAQRRFSSLMKPENEFSVGAGNYDTTSRQPVNLIVLHTVVGTVQGAINRFGTPGSQVSAHYVIGTDGIIHGGLEEFYTAYHAGNYPINQRSIGIEHEDKWSGPPAPEPTRPDTLYAASSVLVADICRYYGFPCDTQHVQPHRNFTQTACPDHLDINRIIAGAQTILNTVIDYRARYNEAKTVLYGPGTSWSKYTKLKTIIT